VALVEAAWTHATENATSFGEAVSLAAQHSGLIADPWARSIGGCLGMINGLARQVITPLGSPVWNEINRVRSK
jgi:hypothetical protein